MAIPTLADLAARALVLAENFRKTYPQYGEPSKKTYGIGKSGSSCAGSTGDKVHVIITSVSNIKTALGKDFTSVQSPCNSTDRRRAHFSVIEGLDTDKVTCTKCCKWLAKVEKAIAAG